MSSARHLCYSSSKHVAVMARQFATSSFIYGCEESNECRLFAYSFDSTRGWVLRYLLNVLICHLIVLTECAVSTEILNSHYFNVATFFGCFHKGVLYS